MRVGTGHCGVCVAFSVTVTLSLAHRTDWAPRWTTTVGDTALDVGVWVSLVTLALTAVVQMVGRDEVPPAIEDEASSW